MPCTAKLLELGADMELEGSDYGTPLMAAATYGRLDVVKVLVYRVLGSTTTTFRDSSEARLLLRRHMRQHCTGSWLSDFRPNPR
jgi:ankyrin repeat protein